MKISEGSRWKVSRVDWLTPELLSQFQYAALTNDQRTVLVGCLDLSEFPTVRELEEVLALSSAPLEPGHER